MDNLFALLPGLARTLIGFYYLFFGIWNIYHWKPMTEVMVKKNIPAPLFTLSIAIGWQTILGGMIMFGILVKLAALLLIPLTIVMAFLLHPFWDFQGELRKQHMALFITNFTMCIGALILLLNNLPPAL